MAAGTTPGAADAWAAALNGDNDDDPLRVVSFLLDNGASPNADDGTFWPLLARVLEAAGRAPRWCPVPVVTAFLEHGANLQSSGPSDDDDDNNSGTTTTASSSADGILRVWQAVLALPQVRGPRPRRHWIPGTPGPVLLRHDHCRHPADPSCALACARLLLRYGADPHVCDATGTTSLAMLALCHPRRPVELLQSLGIDDRAALYPLLDRALTDALRMDSLRRLPRGRHWDCYPPPAAAAAAEAARVSRPDAVVRFLLARGAFAPGTATAVVRSRTRMILDRWDPEWPRFVARGRRERKTRGQW